MARSDEPGAASVEAVLRQRVDELEARVALLEGVVEAIPDPLFVKDAGHRIILVNRHTEALVQRARAEMLGRTDAELFPAEQVEGFWEEDDRVLRGEADVSERLEQLQDADGALHLISTRKALGHDPRGEPLVVGTIRDVSEAHRRLDAQAARARTTAVLLERLTESFPMGIALFDADGTLALATGPDLRRMGLTPERLAGEPLEGLAPLWPEVVEMVRGALRGAVSARTLQWRGVERFVTVSPVYAADGAMAGATLISQDRSQQQAMEHRLAVLERMDSLGRLAGGVAHDLNNLLSIMLMGTSALRDALAAEDVPAAAAHAALLERSIDRGSRLSRQLVAFARRQVGPPAIVDVGRDLEAVRVFLGSLVDSEVDLRFTVPTEPMRVHLQPGQLEQVLIHLVGHAAQTAKAQVRVEVEGRRLDGDPELRPGEYVCLRVHDEGPALSQEARERLFEPFFDPDGRGGGMALATCYGIARQAGGRVRAIAGPDGGNLIEVLLPRTREQPLRGGEAPAPAPRTHGGVRVLLVEDDPVLREQVREFLQTAGHRVVACEDGMEARDWLEAQGFDVDVVVSDVVMPRWTGVDLAGFIEGRVPVVLMTGFIGDRDHDLPALARRFPILDKPVRPSLLLEAIARAVPAGD